jgi:hypothetical protein
MRALVGSLLLVGCQDAFVPLPQDVPAEAGLVLFVGQGNERAAYAA